MARKSIGSARVGVIVGNQPPQHGPREHCEARAAVDQRRSKVIESAVVIGLGLPRPRARSRLWSSTRVFMQPGPNVWSGRASQQVFHRSVGFAQEASAMVAARRSTSLWYGTSAPARRCQGKSLSCSCASPCGSAVLVTQDPEPEIDARQSSCGHRCLRVKYRKSGGGWSLRVGISLPSALRK